MKAKHQSIILGVILVLSAVVMVLLQTRDSTFNRSGPSLLDRGKPAPDFSLYDLEGDEVRLSDYRGKVVLLNIWATWCPSCVEEMPSMEKLHQNLQKEGLVIIAVSIDASGLDAVKPFMKEHKLTFPALVDPDGTTRRLYRLTGVPESFVIDREGIIVDRILGPRDWGSAEVIRYFRKLIAD